MGITQEDVKEWFIYKDGKLFWKKRPHPRSKVYAGDRAGSYTTRGYRQVKFKGKVRKEHGLIYILFHGYQPRIIDHIDKITINNQIENLREADFSQSRCNTARPKNNTSGYKGVQCRGAKFRAIVKYRKQRYDLGLFITAKEAHAAYCKKAKELHGEFFHP